MKEDLDTDKEKLQNFKGDDKIHNFLEFYIPFLGTFKKSIVFFEKLKKEINKNLTS